jgi:hypothetical protein
MAARGYSDNFGGDIRPSQPEATLTIIAEATLTIAGGYSDNHRGGYSDNRRRLL